MQIEILAQRREIVGMRFDGGDARLGYRAANSKVAKPQLAPRIVSRLPKGWSQTPCKNNSRKQQYSRLAIDAATLMGRP
jgi:hypothetical protein